MTNFDLLVDGYVAYTFTPQVAAVYLRQLCKINDPRVVQTFSVSGWPGAFFITNPPMNHCRPHHIGNNQYAWLLDYAIRPGGTVVPQLLWSPQGQGDWRRYVQQATLNLPVFFVNADGSLGVPVAYAAAGQMTLRNAKEPPPLGDKTTTKIRISVCFFFYTADAYPLHLPLISQWPGYPTSEQQVQLRDQTPARNPVTLERFVKHVGSRVRQYLIVRFFPIVAMTSEIQRFQECERPVNNPYSPWFVGPNGINFNEVMLIGVVQVSAGSWMPILQLMHRVVM